MAVLLCRAFPREEIVLTAMEVSQIKSNITDLTERSAALRGYL